MSKRGFSLLETLIAAGILIVVTLAIVGLSNSLIAGTIINSDKTIINRWAAEGIELTQKIRDDNLLSQATAATPGWFVPAVADNGQGYGWYKLIPGAKTSQLTKVATGNNISEADFKNNAEVLTSDQTTGYRLICVEAVSASAPVATSSDTNPFHCNTQGTTVVQDGRRDQPTATTCQTADLYCQITKASVNKNRLDNNNIIPSGTAVKIRSVVVWDEKNQVHSSSIATLLTNWRGSEQ